MYSIWDSLCPYCNNELKKIPKSKTRCPSCGNFIYISTTVDGQKFAVTEQEKEQISNIKRRASTKHTIGRTIVKSIIKGLFHWIFISI